MKDVTACVKTFLRDDYLFDCVKSLRTTYPDMPISVADDGDPSDKKEARLRDMGVNKYIRLPFNVGLSAGRNVLVDAVDTPYLLLSDDDHLYTQETHVEYLRGLMDIADIAGGAFLSKDGGVSRYTSCLRRNPDGRFDLVGCGWPSFSAHNGIRYLWCNVNHNFFVAHTDVVRRVRWDENLRIRYEHEDFFMTAWLQKVKIVHCPDVLLLHKKQEYVPSREYLDHRWDADAAEEAFRKKWGFSW